MASAEIIKKKITVTTNAHETIAVFEVEYINPPAPSLYWNGLFFGLASYGDSESVYREFRTVKLKDLCPRRIK